MERLTERPGFFRMAAGNETTMKRVVLLFGLLAVITTTYAQPKSQFEVMCGANASYRDVNWNRLYDVWVALTPSVKWHFGSDWQATAGAYVPVVCYGYGHDMTKVRMSMAVLSKQLHLGANQHFKLSAGFFSSDRYGLDLRWMYPITNWLMVQARGGFTGKWTMVGSDKGVERMDKLTGSLGLNVYFEKWNTEARIEGGEYVYNDWGIECTVMRHFPHTSVGLFGAIHEPRAYWSEYTQRHSGGFKVVVMLPPYKKSKRKFVVRPTNNFHTTYNAQSNEYSMRMYLTDPEENQRTYAVDVDWGIGKAEKE